MIHLTSSGHQQQTTTSRDNFLSLSSILLQKDDILTSTSKPISSSSGIIIQNEPLKPQKEDVLHGIQLGNSKPFSWKEFVKLAPSELSHQEADKMKKQWDHFESLNYCSSQIVDALIKPGLSEIEFDWCKWTLSPDGGQVKVGTSYGKLNGPERDKYEQLGCNSVANGNNPSCDHVS